MRNLTTNLLLPVPCPTCGAAPGQPCVLHSGSPRCVSHEARKSSARELTSTSSLGNPIPNPAVNGLNGARFTTKSSSIFPKSSSRNLPQIGVHPARDAHGIERVGEPIKFAFFLNEGLASILSIMADGETVELGLFGGEGFVGVPLIAGLHSSPTRVITQIAALASE